MTWTADMESELRYRVQREYRAQQLREATCLGKAAFESPELARAARPKRTLREAVEVYRCRVCRKWHIGTHVGRSDRQKRRVIRLEAIGE